VYRTPKKTTTGVTTGVTAGVTIGSILGERVIDKAVQPLFAWFSRCDDRMALRARVLAGVPVGGRIAAERDAAVLTRAEVHPLRPDLDALFTLVPARPLHRIDGRNVRARIRRG
jgi:hypothetical protein